jgi:hypothetical protein
MEQKAMSISVKTERGVMVMKNGRAWGQTHADGHSTSYGWMDAASAPIHDPAYCKSPTDVTYAGSPDSKELETGSLVPVVRTITVELVT